MPLRRSAATDELLRTWEVENPVARQRFGELMTASGIEPPDTDLLAWGDVMGYDESRVGDRVATALEQAIEDDLLTPGARWLRRTQAQVAGIALMGPWEDDKRRTRLDAVNAERLHGGLATAAHAAATSATRSSNRCCRCS